MSDPARSPVPMLLWCPKCGGRHIDRGEFAVKIGNYIFYSLSVLLVLGVLACSAVQVYGNGRSHDTEAFSSVFSVAFIRPFRRYQAGTNTFGTFFLALAIWALLLGPLLWFIKDQL